jgi:hypothetical protein
MPRVVEEGAEGGDEGHLADADQYDATKVGRYQVLMNRNQWVIDRYVIRTY